MRRTYRVLLWEQTHDPHQAYMATLKVVAGRAGDAIAKGSAYARAVEVYHGWIVAQVWTGDVKVFDCQVASNGGTKR